jgi:serine phosphatase RsbU (regulator of sigma subunit)/type II secretory pathway pseudopilin PulG
VTVIAIIGLLVTLSVSWAVWHIDRSNEHRLLETQTRQAASVLSSAIIGIQAPLQTALDVASATHGDPQQFERFIAADTGPTRLFVSDSLWRTDGAAPSLITSDGVPAGLAGGSAAAVAFIRRAMQSTTFVVTTVTVGGLQRIGYALVSPQDPGFAVYAEREIPANRMVPVERNSAFADLYYATYLGSTTSLAALETADIPSSQLPLSGDTVRMTIPFGDTTLTLVTSPIGHLGGALQGRLAWILLVSGLVLTVVAAGVAGNLARRRSEAERDAGIITGLYGQLDELYADQRSIAQTLQHALLPQTNPAIPGLEFATRYVAGVRGVDIGGDWFSVVQIDDERFAFAVGDVSGRGVEAAAIMARIRFTLRAYLVEGHPPDTALALTERQLDITRDGHLATVLVGVADLASRTVTIANAGHLNPIAVSNGQARFVQTSVGVPLGASPTASYASTTLVMSPGSILFAFTDGLAERRGEDLQLGLDRLAAAATAAPQSETLDGFLTTVLSTMTGDGSEDDIAILAFRWADADRADAHASGAAIGAEPATVHRQLSGTAAAEEVAAGADC